jgi:hypothetical protein
MTICGNFLRYYKCRCDARLIHNSPKGLADYLTETFLNPPAELELRDGTTLAIAVNSGTYEQRAVRYTLRHFNASVDHASVQTIESYSLEQYLLLALDIFIEHQTRPAQNDS